MGSNKHSKNSLKRKQLEEEKALLQLAAVMRQRTGQPDSKLDELAFKRVNQQLEQLSKEETMPQDAKFPLDNLPFDPAQEAGKSSTSKPLRRDSPNQPETEEDGIRAEALRRVQVRRLFQGQRGRFQG